MSGAGAVTFGGLASAGEIGGPPIVEISITKTVAGTDPGIVFPITLTCDSQGGGDMDLGTQDFQIPNDGSASEVVHLANGASTVVSVTLPESEPDLATCRVTEDLSGTALPAGVTCTPSITPESVVVYDGSESQGGAFTVTNTCTQAAAAVEAVPVVTG